MNKQMVGIFSVFCLLVTVVSNPAKSNGFATQAVVQIQLLPDHLPMTLSIWIEQVGKRAQSNLSSAMGHRYDSDFQQADYSIQTSSVPSATPFNALASANFGDLADCQQIEAPVATLETRSKYSDVSSSRSVIDDEAFAARQNLVQPIRNSIRLLTRIAYETSISGDLQNTKSECFLQNLDRWAANGSLTRMNSPDALLSRDRWIAEISLALVHVSSSHKISASRVEIYKNWLIPIAKDTIEAYSFRMGNTSRMNNHRYWAGLSVASVGFFLKNDQLIFWGKKSFDIGVCQVDAKGFLPAELSRGKKALEYHLYALRPLAALAKLSSDEGQPIQSKCIDGLARLTDVTRKSLNGSTIMKDAAGIEQDFSIKESSYSTALQMTTLGIAGA